jgi:hypothetical protein
MPAFPLCVQCLGLGYCGELRSPLVTDAELNNPEFIRDVRACAHSLKITRDRWLVWLEDAYRDYPGMIVDESGEPVPLEFSAFETASIRYWFRDFIERETPAGSRPRLREEARERVRILATLLRAVDPVGAANWGIRAMNDNAVSAPAVLLSLSYCPHQGRVAFSPPKPANDNKDDLPF